MEGSTSPKTIRLLGPVNKKLLNILLDIGSTHNFIDPRVIQRTGLSVLPDQTFQVTVAGGNKLRSEGIK